MKNINNVQSEQMVDSALLTRWNIERITKKFPRRDNIVGVVEVGTNTDVYRQSMSKIFAASGGKLKCSLLL